MGLIRNCHASSEAVVLFVLPLSGLVHAPTRFAAAPTHPHRACDLRDTSLSPIEWLFCGGTFLFLRGPSIDSSPLVHVDASLGLGPRTRTVPRHVDRGPYPRGPPRIFSTIRFVRMSTDTAQDGVTVSCCPAWEQAGEGVVRGDEAPRLGISDPRDRVAPTPPRGKGTNRTDRMCTG